MASIVYTRKGNKRVLRNPAEKSKRYARQLKNGAVSETGEVLTDTQKAWRSGYLEARKDNAKAYNHNKKRGR